jgi:parallel beta-helix repeat protein
MTSSPRDVLVEIIARQGDVLLATPSRCEGLLKDYCGDHRREISAIMTCLRSGTALQLRQQNGTPIRTACSNLSLVTVERNPAICSDLALWAMETWAVALRLLDPSAATAPLPDFNAPLPSEIGPPSVIDAITAEPSQAENVQPQETPAPESAPTDFIAKVFDSQWPVPDWSLVDTQVVVYPDGSGQKPTLTEALRTAGKNTCLMLKPGIYKESLAIKRNVQIRGDGEPGEIILEAVAPAISLDGGCLFISGVTFKGVPGKEKKAAATIEIKSGRLHLEYCNLTSESSTIIEAKGKRSEVLLRHCHLHDGKAGGIVFQEAAIGYLEDCHLYQNKLSHVVIGKDCSPTLTACKISNALMAGIYVNDGGAGLIENCDIWGNAVAGIQCQRKGNPRVRHSRISLNQRYGVLVTERGESSFEQCQIFDNERSGVTVSQQSKPTFSGCQIFDNRAEGIEISDQSEGEFLDCEIFNNENPNLTMKDKSMTAFHRCQFHDGRQEGIQLLGAAEGLFDECSIFANAKSGLVARDQSKPVAQKCKFYDGKEGGITVQNTADGVFTDCSLINHAGVAVTVEEKAQGRFERCDVRDNPGGDWNLAPKARVRMLDR